MTPALTPETMQSTGVLYVWALPCALVDAWVLPLLCEMVVTLLAAEELQVEVFQPRPV